MPGIPSVKRPSWLVKDTWPAVVGLVLGFLANIFAIVKEAKAPTPSGWQLAALGVVLLSVLLLGVMKIAQARYKDRKEDNKSSPNDLRACLHVLHAAVAGFKGINDPGEGWLRITVHRIDGQTLEQAVDYVGSEEPDDSNRFAGRRFDIRAGLIGRVARTGVVRNLSRPQDMNFEEWAKYLVDDFAMIQSDADKTRKDRFAFMGVPITRPGGRESRGVVYLDAGSSDFFDEQTRELVIDCCAGVARWIEERYYH